MIAIDSDVLTLFLKGDPTIVARMRTVPPAEQMIPIVVAAEMLRGRLHAVRQAEAGRGKISLERAFELVEESIRDARGFSLLSYNAAADSQFLAWRKMKIRVGANDLRIAAIAVVHCAKLVTRNIRDFGTVPGLNVEVW